MRATRRNGINRLDHSGNQKMMGWFEFLVYRAANRNPLNIKHLSVYSAGVIGNQDKSSEQNSV